MAITEVVNWEPVARDNISPHPTGPDGRTSARVSLTAQELMAAIARWKADADFAEITVSGDASFGGYIQPNTSTTAALVAIANAINTDAGKIAGSMVFNTDTNSPVYAGGDTDGALWYDGTGALAHTPA